MHAMINKPGLFRAYFAQSPYLDDKIGTVQLNAFESWLQASPEQSIYFNYFYGSESDLEPGLNRLQSLLKQYAPETLVWDAQNDMGKTHMTTRLLGQYQAQESFFTGHWTLSEQQLSQSGKVMLEKHLDELSKRYGYDVLFNESAFVQAAQRALLGREFDAAISVSTLFMKQYPQSILAGFIRAQAEMGLGHRDKAIEVLTATIVQYESKPKQNLQPVYQQMKQVLAALSQ